MNINILSCSGPSGHAYMVGVTDNLNGSCPDWSHRTRVLQIGYAERPTVLSNMPASLNPSNMSGGVLGPLWGLHRSLCGLHGHLGSLGHVELFVFALLLYVNFSG